MTNRLRGLPDVVLLPAALVVVVFEDVVWAGAKRVLRRLSALPPVRELDAWMGTLPGWAALPLFLIPELVGRVGEIWALVLLADTHFVAAAAVYILVRLFATLIAVFVYRACEAALMRFAWFAWCVRVVLRIRDWALALVAPWRAAIRAWKQRAPVAVASRFAAMRWAIAARLYPSWRR